jgi:hypothetical protein
MRTFFSLFMLTLLPLITVSVAQQSLEPASLAIIPAQLAKPAVQRPAPDVLVLPYLNPDGTVATPKVTPALLEPVSPAPEITLDTLDERRLTPLSDSVPNSYLRGHPKFVPLSRMP